MPRNESEKNNIDHNAEKGKMLLGYMSLYNYSNYIFILCNNHILNKLKMKMNYYIIESNVG